MRFVLVACAVLTLVSSPAAACRGLWEYPQTMVRLAQLDLSIEQRNDYKKVLDDGWALHQRGEATLNPDMMRDSLRILDEIKAKIGM